MKQVREVRMSLGKCPRPDCKGDIILDRDIDGNRLTCDLCMRELTTPEARAYIQSLIIQRNSHGFNNNADPIKKGKMQYGHTKLKER